jgi:GT2 family glycosyltransferase
MSVDGAGDAPILAPAPSTPVEPLTRSPTFSIVITAYQVAATIATAIDSALAQTRPAHEVIVVDDGSTDDLDGALRRYRDLITLLRKPNGGAASAHNMAAATATGDFLVTLDADDAFHPRRVEALSELAQARPDLDLITTDARFVVAGSPVGSFLQYNPFEVEDQRAAILRSCFVGGWCAVRRTRLLEIGGFDESLRTGQDWDCWLRLILDGSHAGLVAVPYYDYVLHAGSLTTSRVSSLWDRVRLLEKAERNPELRPAERQALRSSLRAHRTRAAQVEIAAALAGDRSWRRLGELALMPGIEPRARVLAMLALTVPPLGRLVVEPDEPPEMRFAAQAP